MASKKKLDKIARQGGYNYSDEKPPLEEDDDMTWDITYYDNLSGLFYETVWHLTSWDHTYSDEVHNAMTACRGCENWETYQ